MVLRNFDWSFIDDGVSSEGIDHGRRTVQAWVLEGGVNVVIRKLTVSIK